MTTPAPVAPAPVAPAPVAPDLAAPVAPGPGVAAPRRVSALDALRGLAIVAMLLVNVPGDRDATPAQLQHAVWEGLTLADLVFPVFLFAVGASLPFSRRPATLRTAGSRAVLLFAVGCALSSVKRGEPAVTMGVLQHVAGAYLLGWALCRLPRRWWAAAAAAVLAAGWAVYALLPAPGVVPGSWSKDLTPAAALDRLVLGGWHPEGLLVTALSAASVVGGALLGARVREGLAPRAVQVLALRHAVVTGGVGLLLTPVVPVVKQLWTPSFALLGHAAACLLVAGLVAVPDRRTGLLRAVGANPLAVYVVVTLASYTVLPPLAGLLVPAAASVVPPVVASVGFSVGVCAAGVALAVALRRRGVFVRL